MSDSTSTSRAPLTYVGGEEMSDANRAYQEALQNLIEALDARKNRMFDPTLLALAEGFLSPTRTGGFGESLGMAAGKVSAAEQQRAKEEQELAKAKLDIAQLNLQQQRQMMMDQPYAAMFAGAQPGAQPMAGQAPGKPAEQVSAKSPEQKSPSDPIVQSMGGVKGRMIAPPQPLPDKNEFFRSRRLQNISYADAEKQWYDLLHKDVEMKDGYIFQRSTGMGYDMKEEPAPVNITLRTMDVPGPVPVATDLAKKHTSLLSEAIDTGKWDNLRSFEKALMAKAPPEQPAGQTPSPANAQIDKAVESYSKVGGGMPGGRIQTASEVEAAATGAKEYSQIVAKGKAQRTDNAMNEARDSASIQSAYEQLDALAKDPANAKIWGAFTNKDPVDQIVKLVSSGVGPKGFTLGVPALAEVARNYKFNDQEMKAFQLAGQLMTQLQLQMAMFSKGSTSDFERSLFSNTAISENDTLDTVKTKIAAALRVSKYRQDLADALGESGLSYDDFARTANGKRLFKNYLTDMVDLVGMPKGAPTAATAGPKEGQKATSSSGRPVIFRNNRWEYD